MIRFISYLFAGFIYLGAVVTCVVDPRIETLTLVFIADIMLEQRRLALEATKQQ